MSSASGTLSIARTIESIKTGRDAVLHAYGARDRHKHAHTRRPTRLNEWSIVSEAFYSRGRVRRTRRPAACDSRINLCNLSSLHVPGEPPSAISLLWRGLGRARDSHESSTDDWCEHRRSHPAGVAVHRRSAVIGVRVHSIVARLSDLTLIGACTGITEGSSDADFSTWNTREPFGM